MAATTQTLSEMVRELADLAQTDWRTAYRKFQAARVGGKLEAAGHTAHLEYVQGVAQQAALDLALGQIDEASIGRAIESALRTVALSLSIAEGPPNRDDI